MTDSISVLSLGLDLETDLDKSYDTDIEMVMDFMKLSFIFDKPETSIENLKEIIKLQYSLLELLPVAQSNRMATIHNLLNDVYRKNKKELEKRAMPCQKPNLTQKKEGTQFVILFYRSSCPACKKIFPQWTEFKKRNSLENFTTLEYDNDDKSNEKIFELFKINEVPTVIKLKLDKSANYAEILNAPIDLENLSKFSVF
jgi:thiol-disulfide isomerase/thioredoxin